VAFFSYLVFRSTFRNFSLCEKLLSLENEKKNLFSFCIFLVYS